MHAAITGMIETTIMAMAMAMAMATTTIGTTITSETRSPGQSDRAGDLFRIRPAADERLDTCLQITCAHSLRTYLEEC